MAVIAALAVPVQGHAASDPDPVERQLMAKAGDQGSVPVIVKLRSHADQQGVVDELERTDQDADVTKTYSKLPLLALNADKEALEQLADSPRVVSIQENKLRAPALDQSIPHINADDVHTLGFRGAGQAVAVLDTGIDRDHPFFGSRIVGEACFSTGGGTGGVSLCPNGNASQTGAGAADAETANCLNGTANICDHGTHVAGIAAGNGSGVTGAPAAGVAPGANIVAIQVFTRFNDAASCTAAGVSAPCVLAYDADQIDGLEQVLTFNNTIDIAAANMSLGSGMNTTACDSTESATKTAIDDLLDADVATVIASGNSGFDNAVGAPGCISTAVTVGGTQDSSDALYMNGNRGPLLDLFAPGQSITSSVPDDAFGLKTGTSMATPHVAGAFAVLRSAYPNASVATLLGYLRDGGVDVSYTSGTTTVSTPRIDLLSALQQGNAGPTLTTDSFQVTVNEGSVATLGGGYNDPEGKPVKLTASSGTITDNGAGRWTWSMPTNDGPAQSGTVALLVTDDKGESYGLNFGLTVNNVAPSVTIDPAQPSAVAEGSEFGVKASFSDPGWGDTQSAQLDWGDGSTGPGTVAVTNGPPADTGTVTGTHRYADNGMYTVKVTVTDDDGGSTTKSFPVQVSNVAPALTLDPGQVKTVSEGSVLNARASFTDPGWADTFSSVFDWGTGETSPGSVLLTHTGPPAVTGDVSASHVYGDNGSFTVGAKVTDDDGGTSSTGFTVAVSNVAPTAVIDESGAVVVNGVPTFIAHSGQPLTFKGRSTDPGSDDLNLSWNWNDGSQVATPYLVNPPGTDPASSPSVQPRDVTDTKAHTFGAACNYDVGFGSRDDDGGTAADSAKVVVQGNAHLTKLTAYWYLQTRPGLRIPPVDLPVSTLNCYLQVAQHMSKVLSEARDVSTLAKAHDLLALSLLNPKRELDQQLLTAWLNFADGSFDLSSPIDTNLDLRPDSTFGAVMAQAEQVRLDPASSNAQLSAKTLLLTKINTLGR